VSHDHHDHSAHDHKDHGHGAGGHQGHVHGPANYDRAFAIGVALNFGFVVVEAVYGILANSLALLADAGHNLSDVAGLLLAWGATWLARKAPTARRTYGYGRSTILAALGNAVLLLVATGAIALEAVQRFADPQPVQTTPMIVVAAIGIAINLGTALMFMRGRKTDINLGGAYLHMMADAAASAGVVVAGIAIIFTGWLWLDPVVSMVIAAVIVLGAWGLLKSSLALSVDSVPGGIDVDAVRTHLESLPDVRAVHDLHIWALSTTETALTVHLVRDDPRLDDAFLARTCHDLRERFGIHHTTIQLETGAVPCAQEPDHVV